ncbi:MAG: sigma-70 family RNA polymerase sigma factor [Oligoflexales bacterium]|nr:sigma-70 family RNA polymerase sigma factor [Oligoflexales bacterium]
MLSIPPVKHGDLKEVLQYLEVSKSPRDEIGKLYYFDKIGPKRISEMLAMSINTVKYHIKNLKRSCLKH